MNFMDKKPDFREHFAIGREFLKFTFYLDFVVIC